MKTENRPWCATSSKWKEASRSPSKAVVLGFLIAMVAMTSVVTINTQAVSPEPIGQQQAGLQMPANAPTIRPAKTNVKETMSVFLDLVRQSSRKAIS